jgi:hypothetical protein
MATAASRCGSFRRYVTRSPQALFLGMPRHKVFRCSRPLIDGGYVDTNLNTERKARILPTVRRAAGLVWGRDVKVFWRNTPSAWWRPNEARLAGARRRHQAEQGP